MRRIASTLVAVGLVVVGHRAASAQTAENLQQAKGFYENLQVERARDMFLQVISPSSPYVVTPEQRVEAYKYLGATLATLGQADSAQIYFRAAIERDPFVDLDPQVFTPQERQVFAQGKNATFKVGARPLPQAARIDPRTEHVTFAVITTHAANLAVEVNNVDEELRFALYAGDNDGLREVQWSGNQRGQLLVPGGPYEVIVTGVSLLNQGVRDSVKILFDITHEFERLEDTLRSFAATDTLPTRYAASTAIFDLVKGAFVAGVALAVPIFIPSDALTGDPTFNKVPPFAVAGVTLLGGVVAYVSLTRNPEIRQNVAENARRRAARDSANAQIVARNNAKLALTKLVFTPVAAAGQ
ncbi:MAG: hypothetical protein HY560_14040 [Gemmatimonadetes bacterium]|nr:hypothetical protein [Gemmatimonadota bacterium]